MCEFDPCEYCEETDYWECACCILKYGDESDFDSADI